MADNNFQMGGRDFKLSKINAMKQYHIVRRISPILGDMLPAMKEVARASKGDLSEDEKLDMAAKIIAPIMNGLSKLSDKDSEFVLFARKETGRRSQTGSCSCSITSSCLCFCRQPGRRSCSI